MVPELYHSPGHNRGGPKSDPLIAIFNCRLVARGVRLRLFIFGERGLCSVPTLSAGSMLATYDAYEVRYVLGGRYEVWKAVFATDEASHESAQPSGL